MKLLKDKRVLITGGTGSLGKVLVRRLLSGEMGEPAKVIVFSRDEAKQHFMRMEYQLKAAATDEIIYRNFQRKLDFRIGDVRDFHSVASALREADFVFNAAALKPKHRLAARLVARGNLPVLVNGYGSYTGATIFTGATIQTPGGVRATVQLGELGSLDLSPNTTAVVDFGDGAVKGTLKRGCAVLTTSPNVIGSLVTPSGASMLTERAIRSSVTACSDDDPAAMGNAQTGSSNKPTSSNPWIFGLNSASTIAMIGAGGVYAARRGKDKSDGFCCCCCCCCCGKNPSPSSPNDCGCK
jgi:hypothetical protein